MILFLLQIINFNNKLPQMLENRHNIKFNDNPFHNLLIKDSIFNRPKNSFLYNCNKSNNSECFLAALSSFYNINGYDYNKSYEYFSLCNGSERSHCYDYLTQLYFFNNKINESILQNSASNTVFGKLFRSNLRYNGYFVPKSCKFALKESIDIAIPIFIQYMNDHFRCLEPIKQIYHNSDFLNFENDLIISFEKEFLEQKRFFTISNNISCGLKYPKFKNLIIDLLNRPSSESLRSREIWKKIIYSMDGHNKSLNLLYNITKNDYFESDLASEVFTIINLYKKLPFSNRTIGKKLIKKLSYEGIEFAKYIYIFSSLLGIYPFSKNFSIFEKYFQTSKKITLIDNFLLGISYFVGANPLIGCDNSFKYIKNFIDQSLIFNDSLIAEKAFLNKDFNLSLKIYQRLSLMGNENSMWNSLIIYEKLKIENYPLLMLMESSNNPLFKHKLIPSNISNEEKINFYLSISNLNPYAAFFLIWKSKNFEDANKYLIILKKLMPNSYKVVFISKLFLKIYFFIKDVIFSRNSFLPYYIKTYPNFFIEIGLFLIILIIFYFRIKQM